MGLSFIKNLNPKGLHLLENIDFNDFSLVVEFFILDIGFNIKFNLKTLNELVKEKIINSK